MTPNKKNKISMIASSLEEQIAFDIENDILQLQDDKKMLEMKLREKYDWDILEARGLWAFGPN